MSRWLKLVNDWFRPKLDVDENALEQFEQLWNDQESGRSVTFMSIAFDSSAITTGTIKEIGLSHWSKQSIQPIAHHWRIEKKVETKDVIEFGHPDSFDFGTTQIITARDVDTVLDDWVLSLSSCCERLCIVVYGDQFRRTLETQWRPPVPATILDLEAAWRQRHPEAANLPFEEVASTSEYTKNVTSTLDHAGNQAYCLLSLLKPLAEKSKKPQDLQEAYE